MSFDELKEMIEREPNKKYASHPFSFSLDDIFIIQSILYSNYIYCGSVESVDDIYNVINHQDLDQDIFYMPYYVIASFDSYINFNETTIDIINGLDDEVYVQIDIREEFNKEELQLFLGITHTRCQFNFMSWINLDDFDILASKYAISNEANPVLVIKEINDTTVNKIINACGKINNPRFRIEISDAKSLEYLDSIIPYLPEQEVVIMLDDELFNEKNPKNARHLLVQKSGEQEPSSRKLSIQFKDMEYDNVEQIYKLERDMEQIKSHIPSNASELDIVTYVTLFMINYFQYDYEMYNKEISQSKEMDKSSSTDINLVQLISRAKGVCRHFASFTKYLLNSLGIECEKISAFGDYQENSSSNGHAFNVVRIDDKLYFLDNTWVIGEIQNGTIRSLAESRNFLASNNDFGHEDYSVELSGYKCESYDRQMVSDSVNRVMNWNNNYAIHMQALKDLFKKQVLKKEKNVTDKIEDAIPGRRIR